jgi:hypothetical protein
MSWLVLPTLTLVFFWRFFADVGCWGGPDERFRVGIVLVEVGFDGVLSSATLWNTVLAWSNFRRTLGLIPQA